MKRPAPPVRLAVVPVDEVREIIRSAVLDVLPEALEGFGQAPVLLDRKGLARALGCGLDTVDRLRREGCPELTVGDVPRFVLADVLAWLRARERGTA